MRTELADPVPRYHRVYLLLRQQIEDGHYPEGSSLAGENEIAVSLGVSRMTVRRALDRLASEGLVSRERGRGTFVLERVERGELRSGVSGLMRNILTMGSRTKVRLISYLRVTAPSDIARSMGLPADSKVWRAERVRLMEDRPFSYLIAHIPDEIGNTISEDEFEHTPLVNLIQRTGVTFTSAEQSITAKIANVVQASALGVEVGSPLISLRRRVQDQRQRVVEHLDALYRPDRYEIFVNLAPRTREGVFEWALKE